nr:hypothetical protein [Tanacetum cinerariifolium]
MVIELLEHAVLANESSQPQSTYEVAHSLTEFKLKKILIEKMDKTQSYLTTTPHKECYDGLIKSYDLDKSLFSTYDKAYSLKRSREDKDNDEDPSAGSDRRLKKRKTSKDIEPTKGLKTKESKSGSSKRTKSQSKSSRKSVQAEEPEFKVENFDMPQNQERNLGNHDEEPITEVASKRDWFTKPKKPQEPTDPNWNVGKTPQQGPTQICTANVHQKHGYSKESRRSSTGSQKLPKEDHITKPETTRLGIRKSDPYTLYPDPQGFIDVDNQGRNRLMRSDELCKFSDGTLTRL